MSKTIENEREDNMRVKYDFSQREGGVRGKSAERCKAGTNLVLLEPDVAEAFPTEADVNSALRLSMEIAERKRVNAF